MPPKKPAPKRGRPPVPKPPNEQQLRAEVRAECRRQMVERFRLAHGDEWVETRSDLGEALESLIAEILPLRAFREAREAGDRLDAFYRQLATTIEAYVEIRPLLRGAEFARAVTFVHEISEGRLSVVGLDSAARKHLHALHPHLDVIAGGRKRMAKATAHAPRPRSAVESERGELLEFFYNREKEGPRPLLNLNRPLDVEELAMVSLLSGQWPAVKAGTVTVGAVIDREILALRLQAKRRKIPLIEPTTQGARIK